MHDLKELALKPVLALLDHNEVHHSERFDFYSTITEGQAREKYVHDVLWGDAKRYTNPTEFIECNAYFWVAPTREVLTKSNPAMRLHDVSFIAAQPTSAALTPFISSFSEISKEDWSIPEIKSCINSIIEQASSHSFAELAQEYTRWTQEDTEAAKKQWHKTWHKLVHQYLRWALVAAMPGPDGAETMRILGRDETLARLETAKELMLTQAELNGKLRSKEERRNL